MKTLSLALLPYMSQSLIHKIHFHSECISLTKGRPLPFSSLPGPVDLPFIGSLLNILWNGGLENQHEIMCKYHQKFGGIFKMNIGCFEAVQIGDPALVESILRHECIYPKRIEIKPWKMYRDYRKEAYGLLTLDGEEWLDMRRIAQPKLMKIKEVAQMDAQINEVLKDFIAHINRVCDEHGRIDDLYFEFNKLSYEIICSVLYNERCGLLHESCTEDALLFIQSVKKMMKYLGRLLVYPANILKKHNTKSWRSHTEAWDNIFATVKKCIDKRINSDCAQKDDLLHKIHSEKSLTKKQLSGLFTDLQIGGVETTANSLLWLIFNLSRHNDVQENILKEIQTVLSPGKFPSAEDLQKMPYLKSCIKESMRVTPTVPFTSRTLHEDTNLGGYLIPQDTIVMINFHAMMWNNDYFPDAQLYKPERWMQPRSTVNPFASLPFGIGKRMCIGRRLAELQLQLTLCWILQNFHISATDMEPVKAIVSGLMIPKQKLPVAFKKR